MSANTFENALNHLWRGGRYAYFWSLASKRSQWFDVADVPPMPTGRDVYFCVHPSANIPRVNTQGEEVEPANVRSRNGTIAAINCLYSEVDAPRDLDAAFHAVNSLEPSPTLIVRSGGGFHLYWFLTEPYTLDTAQKRAYARDLQSRWVTHTGGDKAAKDLARVLRVPGTLNGKYEPPRAVEIVAYESSRLYELQSLVNVLPKRTKATQKPATGAQTPVNGIIGKMFASKHGAEIQALWNGDISKHGNDHSAADLALMNHLAFWARKDAGAMEQLFGQSELGKRDKWVDREYYRQRTIEAAIAGTTEVYTNGNGAQHTQTTINCRAQNEAQPEPLTIPDDADPRQWAMDNVEQLAGLDKLSWARVETDLMTRGASARYIDRTLKPAIKAARKAAGNDSTWAALQADIAELGYTLRLNDLEDSIEVNGERLTDVTEAVMQMQLLDRGHNAADWNRRGIIATANLDRYNPVREFLDSLQWDGTDRIAQLERYVRDEHDRIEYADGTVMPIFGAWLRRWGIGAVAKAWGKDSIPAQNPMLVLSGDQNLGKSTLARWLCPMPSEYFIDSPVNPEDKDHARYACTKLVWEVGELGATTRKADREALKAFLTRAEVTLRPAYARHDIRKRTIVSFIGTINPEIGFLNDPSGNRRFLPVNVTSIDHSYYSKVDPVQLWAQFAALYRAGESWRLTREEWEAAELIRSGHEVESPMMGYLIKYCDLDPDGGAWTPTVEIVDHLRKNGAPEAHVTNVGLALRKLGLERDRKNNQTGYYGIKPSVVPEFSTGGMFR